MPVDRFDTQYVASDMVPFPDSLEGLVVYLKDFAVVLALFRRFLARFRIVGIVPQYPARSFHDLLYVAVCRVGHFHGYAYFIIGHYRILRPQTQP